MQSTVSRIINTNRVRRVLKEKHENAAKSLRRVRDSRIKTSLVIVLLFNTFLNGHRAYHSLLKPTHEKIESSIGAILVEAGIIDHGYNKTAADRQQELMYAFLRQIALGPSANTDSKEPVKQRFVLQIPGKILNPDDYDPKDPSIDETIQRFSSFVPPHISENMFRLTDIVPVANPVRGGETGESFSEIYEKALRLMDIRSFDKMSEEERERYEKAVAYLAEIIPDPQNVTDYVSRFSIYSRLRRKYDDLRLKMEEKMKEVEDTLSHDPIEYQRWFQIHFPTMQAELEDVYTEWLVFGQKDIVELYKAYLDVGSHVVDLQKARMSLRSSSKTSLDRASAVYPVHFEPSDWYEYLRPKTQGVSSLKHLEMKLGDIDAKLTTLKSMLNGGGIPGAVEYIQSLRDDHIALENNLTLLTQEVGQKKLACIARENEQSACEEYRSAQSVLMATTKEYAMKHAQMSNTMSFLYTDDVSKKQLQEEIKNLEKKRKSTVLMKYKLKDKYDDDNEMPTEEYAGWTEFHFSSVESKKQMQASSLDYASSINSGTGRKLWSFTGGSNDGHSATFQEKINKNEFKVKGKILKVTISRPWFKSSLFKSGKIKTRDDEVISPGPMEEKKFVKNLNQDNKYILPEFANAFLLAKDIEMEFVGVDAKSRSYALEQSAKGQLSGSLGCFSVSSSSFDYTETRMEAESTVNGLKIKVPGAQIIGYFTTILPCFPHNLCRKWGIF